MASVRIIKGSLRNVVDEIQFEKLYKPNGWRLDTAEESINESEEIKAIKILNSETEVKNYVNMKKKKPKSFNDKLFKDDIERDT